MLNVPLWLQQGSYPARQDRTLLAALFTEGVMGTGDLAVTQRAAGTNMSVDIAAGSAAISGTTQDDQGVYLAESTAVENRAIAAAPATGTRTDLVVGRVRDSAVSGTSNDWLLEVITGVDNAGVPATPDDAIPLASVAVAAGTATITNAMITDLRVRVVPATLANVFQVAGDMIRGTGNGTAERLPVGNAGDVLTVSGGTAIWQALPPGTDDVRRRGDWTAGPIFLGTDETNTFTSGQLTRVDHHTQAGVLRGREDFTYNPDGTLATATRTIYADDGTTVQTTISESYTYTAGDLTAVGRTVT